MIEHDSDRLWDREDVIEYLGISRSSYQRLMARDEIPYVKICSKTKFIPEQVKAWIKKKSAESQGLKKAKVV